MARTQWSSLNSEVDLGTTSCLNAVNNEKIKEALGAASTFIQSEDADLLVTVQFKQPVKIASIVVKGLDTELDAAPKVVKLFANRDHMSFSDASSDPPTQELELTEEQATKGEPVDLRFVKFQAVHTLTVFIEDSFGGEALKLEQLAFFGKTMEAVDMKSWAPVQKEKQMAHEDM